MDENFTKKRKVEEDDVPKPAAKSPKLSDEVIDDPLAGTRLPPEIWLKIFDYLKPKDNCMKPLSVVCKQFNNICSLRLRVLHLDFAKIFATKCYPVIKRAYSEIRMTGNDVDSRRKKVGPVLASSGESARKLVISGYIARSSKRCKVRIRTLMFILNNLPNLEEVELLKVDGVMPAISFEQIKPHEQPQLTKLRKLTMSDVTAVTCTAFEKARNVEEIRVNLTFKTNKERAIYLEMVTSQPKLRVLHNLQRYSRIYSFIERVFENNLKLEHIETYPNYVDHWRPLTFDSLTPLPDLKTLEIRGNIQGFDADQIRTKFPSLKSFTSENVQWRA